MLVLLFGGRRPEDEGRSEEEGGLLNCAGGLADSFVATIFDEAAEAGAEVEEGGACRGRGTVDLPRETS